MRKKMKHILFMMMSAVLAASCSQDVLDDGQGNSLPEGMYPLELTAGGLQAVATPETRSTIDGTWPDGKSVAVQAGDKVKEYIVSSDGKLTGKNADNTHYWSNTNDLTITAWYPYNGTMPAYWDVPENQSQGLPADKDFLYARKVASFDKHKDGVELQFYHQLAKVVVNIRNTGIAANMDITDVKLNGVYLSGNYTTIDEEIEEGFPVQGSWQTTGEKAAITMGSMETVQDADFGNGAETAKASYSALVIPQQTRDQDIRIEVGINGATYAWSLNNVLTYTSFYGGYQYTFNITVRAEGLNVEHNLYSTWKDGSSENIEKITN